MIETNSNEYIQLLNSKHIINNKIKEEKKLFKNKCIEYMNSANYYKISSYLNHFTEIYNEKERNFPLDLEKLKNLIKSWKSKTNKFTKYTIFDNAILEGNNYILRAYNYYLFFTGKSKIIKNGEYAIWMDNTSIAHMRQSEHYQFDTTWYKPNGFTQLLIGLEIQLPLKNILGAI